MFKPREQPLWKRHEKLLLCGILNVNKCYRARKNLLGFTLVELLVVIAILSLLFAIGLAVGASVRERGRRTVCVSNLRQIGQALQMYRQDWEDPIFFLPIGLRDLYPKYVTDMGIFKCPNDTSKSPISYGYQYIRERLPGHLLSWEGLYAKRGEDFPIVYDNHHYLPYEIYPVLVLRLNGRVEIINRHIGDGFDY